MPKWPPITAIGEDPGPDALRWRDAGGMPTGEPTLAVGRRIGEEDPSRLSIQWCRWPPSLPRGEEEGEGVLDVGHTESKGCSGSGLTGRGSAIARGLAGRGPGDCPLCVRGGEEEPLWGLPWVKVASADPVPLPDDEPLVRLSLLEPKACRRGLGGKAYILAGDALRLRLEDDDDEGKW